MIVMPLAACGTGDEAAFATTTDSTGTELQLDSPTAVASGTSPSAGAQVNAVPTTGARVEPTAVGAGVAAASEATADAQMQELVVSFTYEPSSSGNAKRPYVAVWVEDGEGNLVDTISLFYEQGGKGSKWLDDLRLWYSASGAQDTTMSSATRVPGVYTVAWDGTDLNGSPIEAGDYVLNIESAREHGPYSFTSTTLTVGSGGVSVELPDDGELSGASAVLS